MTGVATVTIMRLFDLLSSELHHVLHLREHFLFMTLTTVVAFDGSNDERIIVCGVFIRDERRLRGCA